MELLFQLGRSFFLRFILSYAVVGIEKKRSNSEIKASPAGKNDCTLFISVDNFRLNCF